jgi:hypothetical protein
LFSSDDRFSLNRIVDIFTKLLANLRCLSSVAHLS